ncbi:hypothetical protein GCM10009530_27600 [Microbispora corallina]|uniref:Uncharacterized protein n=1 Tax=Microbispora corallina TaxID=83302 RepID=A0ABQ4FZB4_9ACTN|nr:hypothetical protein Mco01_31450 [Microbispora corallina]
MKKAPIARETRFCAWKPSIRSSALASRASWSSRRVRPSSDAGSGSLGASSMVEATATASASMARSTSSQSTAGPPASTRWPIPSSTCPAATAAAATSGSTPPPDQEPVVTATRSAPGSAPGSDAYGRSGGGAVYLSPTPGPSTASSIRAASRTVRVRANS